MINDEFNECHPLVGVDSEITVSQRHTSKESQIPHLYFHWSKKDCNTMSSNHYASPTFKLMVVWMRHSTITSLQQSWLVILATESWSVDKVTIPFVCFIQIPIKYLKHIWLWITLGSPSWDYFSYKRSHVGMMHMYRICQMVVINCLIFQKHSAHMVS